eukprot:scaffold74475_cov32-Tisochrysis_lutea.AAC.7
MAHCRDTLHRSGMRQVEERIERIGIEIFQIGRAHLCQRHSDIVPKGDAVSVCGVPEGAHGKLFSSTRAHRSSARTPAAELACSKACGMRLEATAACGGQDREHICGSEWQARCRKRAESHDESAE